MLDRLAASRPRLARAASTLFALADQALFAVSNLLLQMALARSVPPEAFGAYTVASTFFLVAAAVHQTCLVEPMFVFTGRRYSAVVGDYHRALRWRWSVAFSLGAAAIGGALAGVAGLAGAGPLAVCLVLFAATSPLVLYLWLLRRMAFVMGRPELSAVGSALYAGLLVAGLALAWVTVGIDAAVAILATGVAAVGASLALVLLLRWPAPRGEPVPDLFVQHVRYGRWALGSEVVSWALINGPILALPVWFGLTASAELRTINLVFMPLLQVVAVVGMLQLRELSSTVAAGVARRTIVRFFWLLVGGSAAYAVAMWAVGAPLVQLAFGPSYAVPPLWLALAGFGYACASSAQAFFVALRASERPKVVLAVHALVLGVLVVLSPLLVVYGIFGVLSAQAVAWSCALLAASLIVLRPPRRLAA